jgi:predicted lipoprotein with Yx(FWY)xxD motif
MTALGIESSSLRVLGLGAATAVLLAACGGAAATPTAVTPTLAPATPAAPASVTAGGSLTIATGTTSVGTVLTGKDGLTLYTWKKDTTPNSSGCTGGCATAWPPVTVGTGETPIAGAGVTGTLATFTRSDGSTQVSYNGAALYYFASDSKAGDATGQGKGDFFVATPSGASGSPAATTGASPAASTAGSVHTVDLVSSAPAHLTGDMGLALYAFKKDGPSTSACTSSNCVANWPPFTVKAGETAAAGTGVTGTIATFARPDGSMQVSWNGQPLYYFAGDTKPADTTGANVSPDWSLAVPKARPGY